MEGKRERKRPKLFSSYIAHMCNLVDDEPYCFEKAEKKQEWKDAMVEEYQSILKNDVWDIVPKLKDKSVVSSKKSIQLTEAFRSTRLDLWHESYPRKKA